MKAASGVDLGAGPVRAVLLRLASPVMLSLFFENLFFLADTVFVSWIGTPALAAMSLCQPLFYTAFAFAKGVAVGTTVLASHRFGEGRDEDSRHIIRAGLPLMTLVVLPWCLLAAGGPARWVLTLLGADVVVAAEGARYLFWLVLSFPVMGYFLIAEAISMSNGDSVRPMKAALLGNGVSIVLKYLFMVQWGMGISGSSLGTLLGWTVSAGCLRYALVRLGRPQPVLAFDRKTPACWANIGALGSQTALAVLIAPLSLGFINLVLARLSIAGVAALNLAMRLEFLVAMPLVGLSNALAPLLGFNLGRRDWERIRQALGAAVRLGETIIIPVMVLFLLMPRPLLAVFRPAEEVLAIACYALQCSALGYLVIPLELTLQGAAMGLKRPWYALLAMAARHLALRIPMVVVLSAWYGIQGVYWTLPISYWISGAICLLLLRDLLSRTRRVCLLDPGPPAVSSLTAN